MRARLLTVIAVSSCLLLAACSSSSSRAEPKQQNVASSSTSTTPTTPTSSTTPHAPLAGMPPLLDPHDIYAADRPNQLSPTVAHFPQRVYVPNSKSNTVDVIDPTTMKVIDHFAVGGLPQHVVPSYDLRTLYVTNDTGNSLTPIDPATGAHGAPIPVEDPYNMYFTPDGKYAIVVAERLQRLDFRDAHTMKLVHSLPVVCKGVDHIDFSADGTYLIASCEFSGKVLKVDVVHQSVVGTVVVKPGSKPQDVKLDPTGRIFYVADMVSGGVFEVDGDAFKVLKFIRTGAGAHGLYVSRDSKTLYVTNRTAGTISRIDFASDRVVGTWTIPRGTPDMGGVSSDATTLWISGRYRSEVYAIDTRTGQLRARIRVGLEPHGLCVYPQPGRYSTGHTGVFR